MSDPRRDGRADGEHDEPGPDPRADEHGDDGRRRGGLWAAVKEIVAIAATALVISFLIKTFLAQAFWIPSGSMEDTLVYGDRVMVSKVQLGSLGVDRGDIVVFEDPGGWLPPVERVDRGPVINGALRGLEFVGVAPSSQGNHLIKRVIGLPGDTVACCDEQGRMTVNGEPLEEDYLFPSDEPSTSDFEITVPRDRIWLMGDHRSNSRDSRANDDGTGEQGSVPLEDVVGQAVVLIYPFDHFDWFTVPDTFADVPDAP
ncbi:Signal peptidase I [Serinicoccus hydrothermalis]|uniref:Signal peptidase I n=1 Tax=Serinicoccus hydrothermalis TaxID=1758689 RepID=A0A1B1NGX3_9MICO|nr:signal peptidase I [Serinicoccus hydrothermalis]ANS80674.1 Signal peptidase I [Serinicoccus hydrothermalis]